ncbi:MAG TPA: M12 family metallo-peptidase, partial [Saprospiraceae bacterium]|nr:M12 family metallo-peptidase [Saprospiraceae bacterium]
MRKTRFRIVVITSFLMMILFAVNGQNPNNIAKWITTQSRSSVTNPDLYKLAAPTRSVPTLKEGHFLEINNNTLASLLVDNPVMIEINLPVNAHETVKLLLAKVEVTAPDFILSTKGNENKSINYEQGIHYRGIIEGDNQSVAALSFFNNEVSGFYSSSKGDYTIGKIKNETDLYAVYNEKLEPHPAFNCFSESLDNRFERPTASDERGVACKVVKVYFECDYKMYQDKGSNVDNVTNYVTAFFNQVATLYQNENIDIQISQIVVWNTPDPYANLNSTSAVLNAFLSTTGPNFNGDVAHFLTTRNLGGGIAYVDVLCVKAYAFGVSAIYNTYSNVPTFSWTIECVTHELGHNLGSPHTQSCTWPGGAIDNCYTTEGGCAPGPPPVNGGTIMSYCHLTNYGINFNNGFGPLPGNKIRTEVTNAGCLAQNGVVPTGLTTTNITSNGATLNWGAVPNTTEYTIQYKLATATAWITAGTSATNAYNLTGLAANSNYQWKVKTSCSDYSTIASFTTVSGTSCSVPTNLQTSSITSSSAIVSWPAVSGASNYTVQYKL